MPSASDTALASWFQPVAALRSVGPKTLAALQRLLPPSRISSRSGITLRDLLFLIPHSAIDRSRCSSVAEAQAGEAIVVKLHIDRHVPPPRNRPHLPYRILCHDITGQMQLTFFRARAEYLMRQFPEGQVRLVAGIIERYDAQWQITHPDISATEEESYKVLGIHPVYPMVAGLTQRQLSLIMRRACEQVQSLPEWGDEACIRERGWSSFTHSLMDLHRPRSVEVVNPDSAARTRLAYDEALANQLALLLVRRQEREIPSFQLHTQWQMHEKFLAALPFKLTKAQQNVLESIYADMASGERMVRLLQGDVGSGKTVVALAAMLQAAAAGKQAVLMAPTDLLARQHAQSLAPIAQSLGVKLGLLTGKMSASDRKQILQSCADGTLPLIVGTHALFQQQVAFAALALVVVDEQHRFGVEQRKALSQKSHAPHIMQMTATPIPRSLTMAAYGDMDTSILADKPIGRKPIDTRAMPLSRIDEVLAGVGRAIAVGERLYWICPTIEPADASLAENAALMAVEERARILTQLFPHKVAVVHGRMKPTERDEAMQGFLAGRTPLLVATTVIEVGVNVPEATVMIIEHAERFGLAQIHQLRGRVGRSDAASSCLLLYSDRCSQLATERIRTIRQTNDGFRIAEEDLRLRGAGDVLGTRQTGLPAFHFIDLLRHGRLIALAREDARYLMHQDSKLSSERGKAARQLLALFGYDEEVAALRSA